MNIQQDKVNSNVYRAKVDDYELEVRVEFPLKGVVITTLEDALEGNRRGTYGLLTPYHEADGNALVAFANLRHGDAPAVSATLLLRNDESWLRFAEYAKCSTLGNKFIEVAHEVAERWIANEWDTAWTDSLPNALTKIEQSTSLTDTADYLNDIIATIEGTRRLVPLVAKIRGDSDELAERSYCLLEARRFLGDALAKKLASVSEVRLVAKKLADILALKR